MSLKNATCTACGVRLHAATTGAHLLHPGTLAIHACCHASWGISYEGCPECQSERFGLWAYCGRCFMVAQSIADALGAALNLQQPREFPDDAPDFRAALGAIPLEPGMPTAAEAIRRVRDGEGSA